MIMRNITIKKMILNQGKWETVEGVPPLTLENGKYGKIRNYKIFGNSIQDGEPTPEAPIQVKSVGDLVTNETDINFGKYKIPVVIPNETKDIITNIYLDEPLRKLGNHTDYIDYENRKIVRQTVEAKFDGSENWKVFMNNSYFYLTVGHYGSIIQDELLSSHFVKAKISYSNTDEGIRIINSGNGDARIMVRPGITGITTLELWQEYLAEQYSNGTPVTACYALTESIEEDIKLPEIYTLAEKSTTYSASFMNDGIDEPIIGLEYDLISVSGSKMTLYDSDSKTTIEVAVVDFITPLPWEDIEKADTITFIDGGTFIATTKSTAKFNTIYINTNIKPSNLSITHRRK